MAIRTFLALEIDEAIRKELAELQRQLSVVGADVRWAEPAQLHVTVKFLGDVPDEQLAEVCRIAAELAEATPAFDMHIGHVSAAPAKGQLRMVWVGIEEPTGRLAQLHTQLDLALGDMGFRMDNRGFKPHLTLGRVKTGRNVLQLRRAIDALAEMQFGVQPAEELVVFGSELKPKGPIYTPLAHAVLG